MRTLTAVTVLAFVACDEKEEKIVLDPCDCYDILSKGQEENPIYDTCNQAIHANDAFLKSYTKCQFAAIRGKGRDTSDVVIPEQKAATANLADDGIYVINTEESSVRFIGKNSILGKKHRGEFKIKEGQITVQDSTISQMTLVLDISSLQETTKGVDPEMATKLVGHLLSPDFFDAEQYPTATFEFKSSNNASFKLELTGDLTIKDVTKSQEMFASISGSGENGMVAGGSFVINRTDFGINYNSSSIFGDLGDNVIEDDVPIAFTIKADRTEAQ